MITENLSTLKIHRLTQEQYDREVDAGQIDANAIYLTPDVDDHYTKLQIDEMFAEYDDLLNRVRVLSDNFVSCEPPEGHPLKVLSTLSASVNGYTCVSLYHSGKNLFDFKATPYKVTFKDANNNDFSRIGFDIRLPAGTYTLHAEGVPNTDYIYGTVSRADGTLKEKCNLVVGNKLENQTLSIDDGEVIHIYNGNLTFDVDQAENLFAKFNVQIEVGSTATHYEPYCGKVLTTDFEQTIYGGSYDWTSGVLTDFNGNQTQFVPQNILAIADTNILYSDTGDTTVYQLYTSKTDTTIESVEHPGCYYRIVDGEDEWVNPPMIENKCYRTTKRFNGYPVYTAAVVFTDLPAAGSVWKDLTGATISRVLNISTVFYPKDPDFEIFSGPLMDTDGLHAQAGVVINDRIQQVHIHSYDEFAAEFSAVCTIEFTKAD